MRVGPDWHGHRILAPETEVRTLDGQLTHSAGLYGATADARGSNPRAREGMQVQLLPGQRTDLEGWPRGKAPDC